MTQAKTSVKLFEVKSNRFVTLIKLGKIVLRTEFSDMVPGEFPMDEWCTFPLEVPSSGFKEHILGRIPGGFQSEPSGQTSGTEVIHLPVYTGEEITNASAFEALASDPQGLGATAKIPVVTLATKFCDNSVKGRSQMALSVLPIWRDSTSLLLELIWTEGCPEEDAINPEWHIQTSPRLPVDQGLGRLRESVRLLPITAKCNYLLYVNPSSLGEHIFGPGREYQNKIWRREWPFDQHDKMLNALDQLADVIAGIGGD